MLCTVSWEMFVVALHLRVRHVELLYKLIFCGVVVNLTAPNVATTTGTGGASNLQAATAAGTSAVSACLICVC